MKAFEKKTKHHYVWAHYLKDWTIDGSNIFYFTKKGNIACDSIRGLGYEKNFYKVGLLRENDRELINIITKNCEPNLKKLHLNFMESMFESQRIFATLAPRALKNNGIDLEDLMSSNIFENYLSQLEARATNSLRHLRKGNLSYFEAKENYYDFCYFLGYQQVRTRKMKNLLIRSLSIIEGPESVKERLADFYQRNWWFMCSFFGTNLSYDMSLNSNREIFVLDNDTELNFITSDQPVININPEGHLGEQIDYYYPLSPRKALLIITSKSQYFDYKNITQENVTSLNEKVALASGETIFAISRNALLECKFAFNNRHYLSFMA